MKFGDRIQLKEEYRNYEGESINSDLGGFLDKETIERIINKKIVCVGMKMDTINVMAEDEDTPYPYGYVVPAEAFEIIEDEKKYSELELQAHKNDSFEKDVEKGIKEEKKWREEALRISKEALAVTKEDAESAIGKAHEEGYQKGKLAGTIEASKEFIGIEEKSDDSDTIDTKVKDHKDYPHAFVRELTETMDRFGLRLTLYNDMLEEIMIKASK